MSTQKNSSRKRKSHPKIDGRYLLKAFGVCLITFIMGVFIGKKLTPRDSIQDLKKQIKQTDAQDQFTFFTTLPNQKPIKTSPQKPQRSPSSKINSKKIKKYTIQVGAFQTKKDAEGLIRILKKKGYSAYLTMADLAEKGVWYRVRVGRFSSHPEAKKNLRTLNMKTGLKSFVTKIK